VTHGTSIGIAISARATAMISEKILKCADLALYSAKPVAAHVRFFEPKLDQLMHARRNLERDLRNGLVNGEFELHYQPLSTSGVAKSRAARRCCAGIIPSAGWSCRDLYPLAKKPG